MSYSFFSISPFLPESFANSYSSSPQSLCELAFTFTCSPSPLIRDTNHSRTRAQTQRTNRLTLPAYTVQVRNLQEKIKIDELKEALTELFSEYGTIVDIIAKTNLKAKGQAFIVFDTVESATNAIDEINGFDLFDKPMVLDYAKSRSDATVLREGGSEELEAHKRRRLAEKGSCSIDFFLLSPSVGSIMSG